MVIYARRLIGNHSEWLGKTARKWTKDIGAINVPIDYSLWQRARINTLRVFITTTILYYDLNDERMYPYAITVYKNSSSALPGYIKQYQPHSRASTCTIFTYGTNEFFKWSFLIHALEHRNHVRLSLIRFCPDKINRETHKKCTNVLYTHDMSRSVVNAICLLMNLIKSTQHRRCIRQTRT